MIPRNSSASPAVLKRFCSRICLKGQIQPTKPRAYTIYHGIEGADLYGSHRTTGAAAVDRSCRKKIGSVSVRLGRSGTGNDLRTVICPLRGVKGSINSALGVNRRIV